MLKIVLCFLFLNLGHVSADEIIRSTYGSDQNTLEINRTPEGLQLNGLSRT